MKHYAVDTTLYVVAKDEREIHNILADLQVYVEQYLDSPTLNSVSSWPNSIRFLYVADEEQA